MPIKKHAYDQVVYLLQGGGASRPASGKAGGFLEAWGWGVAGRAKPGALLHARRQRQAAGQFFAGPAAGSPTYPTFRAMANSDLPDQGAASDLVLYGLAAHGGRPHWAKRHSLGAEDVVRLYPEARRWGEVRKRADPQARAC